MEKNDNDAWGLSHKGKDGGPYLNKGKKRKRSSFRQRQMDTSQSGRKTEKRRRE